MDLSELLKRSAAAREFEAEFGAVVFRLRLPTPFEQRRLAADCAKDGRINFVALSRAIVDAAVIGWRGVTERDFLPDAPSNDTVDFSKAALAAFLDERLAVVDGLAEQLEAKLVERVQRLEDEKKP